MQDLHAMPALDAGNQGRSKIPGAEPVKHSPDDHGPGNQMVAEYSQNRMGEPGRGLEGSERRVLLYTDLKSLVPYPDQREPEREIELHLTGHMNRYMWSFDGKKYSEAKDPIRFRYGERVRLTFVNDTMMEHPLHLHGMWMHLENGAGAYLPTKTYGRGQAGGAAVRRRHRGRPWALGISLPSAPPHGSGDVPRRRGVRYITGLCEREVLCELSLR